MSRPFAAVTPYRWEPSKALTWLGMAITLAILAPLAAVQVAASVAAIPALPGDVDAYWQAALRLRSGEPLYAPAADVLAVEVYRYSPWFAWAWVPLTFLPEAAVHAIWRALMVLATGAALIPLIRRPSISALAAAVLIGWLTIQTALFGNVQPLLIAALVWGADRRSGPLWIGIAASLKFVPILYVIVYVVRGEWRRAAIAIGIALVLLVPMLAYDLSAYTTRPGASSALFGLSPFLWAAVAVVALAAAAYVAARRPRFAWLAASVAMILAYPQAHLSYASHLLVGTREPADR
jgi:hypothetical protein